MGFRVDTVFDTGTPSIRKRSRISTRWGDEYSPMLQGLRFGVKGLGFRVYSLWSMVHGPGLGITVYGLGFRVVGLWFRV
jgi:hypothetical protein